MVKYLNMLTDWKKVYLLPFQSTLESKDREFQYKVLNRIVFTNEKLCCLGIVESPICAFCLEELESVEHLIFSCTKSSQFGNPFCNNKYNKYVGNLTETDPIFGKLGFLLGQSYTIVRQTLHLL